MHDVYKTVDTVTNINVKMSSENMTNTIVTVGGICGKRKTFLRRTFTKIKNWFR